MKFTKKYLPLLFGVAIATGIFIGSKLDFEDTNERIFATNSKKDKLNRLIDYIDYEYVDKVNTDSIVDVTVNSILEDLDPHSVYISKQDYASNADDMRGNFTGIGVSFYVYNDSIAVIKPIEDGPAFRAGIKGGDRILSADGITLYGENLERDSIPVYLKGKRNTWVDLEVYRKSLDTTLRIKVKRNEVPLQSVDASYMLTTSIGYIKINRFSETTYDEFEEGIDKLLNEDMKTLILDLRDNPGGYIDVAQQVADEFLKDDTLILITKNKEGEEDKTFATRKGDFEDGKVYVLINENSASASEIIAGALQDNDVGVIVGRRSFGKGLVQREMALGDGSAIRLTIARYYTPTGRSIQRPYENGTADYYNEYQKRYANGELMEEDSIQVTDTLRYTTPKGKIVYGGGGITPDVFIAKDTSVENETINYISQSGSMSYFVFETIDRDRKEFEAYSPKGFKDNYTVPDALVEAFIEYVSKISGVYLSVKPSNEKIKRNLKATMAEQLYGTAFKERILNEGDAFIDKVLSLEVKNTEVQQ